MAGGLPQRRWALGSPDPEESRERLIVAISRTVAERGGEGLTVEGVARSAGVPPAVFYEHFAGLEQGLMAAYDAFLDRLRLEVDAACEGEASWPAKVRAALGAVLEALAESSALARVFAVEAAAASPLAAQRQLAALDDFAALLRHGRGHCPPAAPLPEATERALVGGIASIVSGHLLAEDTAALTALGPQLVELVLTPYVGAGEAKRVAAGA